MAIECLIAASLLSFTASLAHAQPTVTKAELFAGSPTYNEPKERAREGQGLLDNPPQAWRSLVFSGDKLVTAVGQEIWYTDLAAPKPVLKRLAGKESTTGQALKPGAGAEARFANIFGLALMADGSLICADQTGNTIFQVKDPFGAGCQVTLLAGTTKPQESVNPGNPPNVGDVDGPGDKAKFGLPMWPAVVGDNIFFIDEGKSKLKQVGGNADRTVKTIAKLPSGAYYAMVALKGKLYTLANNSTSEGFILEIDPATGTIREVVKGRAATFEGNGAINISGLTTDGTGLFITQSGLLLYVTLDGKVTSLAGTGNWFEFRQPYDATIEQKPDLVQTVHIRRINTTGSNIFLAYKDNAVYFSAANPCGYIERFTLK